MVMPAVAATSAIRDRESFLTVTPGLESHTRILAPAAPAATARRAASGVRTIKIGMDPSCGGAGTSPPSSARSRERAAVLSFRTPDADRPHSRPFTSIGTMKMTAPAASSALTKA
jgi:hypothetical protein